MKEDTTEEDDPFTQASFAVDLQPNFLDDAGHSVIDPWLDEVPWR